MTFASAIPHLDHNVVRFRFRHNDQVVSQFIHGNPAANGREVALLPQAFDPFAAEFRIPPQLFYSRTVPALAESRWVKRRGIWYCLTSYSSFKSATGPGRKMEPRDFALILGWDMCLQELGKATFNNIGAKFGCFTKSGEFTILARRIGEEFSRPPTYCTFTALFCKSLITNGAGDGNRTHVCSLEGCRSTIELHPQRPKSYRPRLPCQSAAARLDAMNSLLLTGGRVVDPANNFDSLADVLILRWKNFRRRQKPFRARRRGKV